MFHAAVPLVGRNIGAETGQLNRSTQGFDALMRNMPGAPVVYIEQVFIARLFVSGVAASLSDGAGALFIDEGGKDLTAHPERVIATVRCTSCGEVFTTRSTRSEITVDVCSNCHPAYTGMERAVQSGSRIERFERRRARVRRTGATTQ
jgi:large subunit ribosomal protein L31